jgi:hypothetical protein
MPHVVRAAFAAAFLATCGDAQSATRAAASRPAADTRPAARDTARERRVLAVLEESLNANDAFGFWCARYETPASADLPLYAAYQFGGANLDRLHPVRYGISPESLAAKLKAAYDPTVDVLLPKASFDLRIDYDGFTPAVAVAADALIRWNRSDAGPDVDVSAVVGDRRNVWPQPEPRFLDEKAGRVPPTDAEFVRVFAVPTTLVFEIKPDAPGAGVGPRKWDYVLRDETRPVAPVAATLGRISLVDLGVSPQLDDAPSPATAPAVRCVVVQIDAQGRRLEAASNSSMIWLTSEFDQARPFEIRATFDAGAWAFWGDVRGTAPSR